jgi:integrase
MAEDDLLNPYLSRNVMMKVVSSKSKLTSSEKAARIEDKILDNDETFDFRLFVAQGYRETIVGHPRILSAHIKNRERDLAIISVVLGSGLRISELLALDLEDIDWVKAKLHVTRKGNKKDAVLVSDIGLSDLKAYINTRCKTYKVKAKFPPLFLSLPTGPSGAVGRLTVRSAQKMLKRYVDAYGKPALSIHKLRHSFATNYHKINKDIAKLKEQLGHEDINTTMIYTHIGQTEQRESVNKADS